METNNEASKKENVVADYLDDIKQIELEGYELGVKKARNALFWTAGLLLLGEIISSFRDGYELTLLVMAIIAVEVGIFVGLAFWTKQKPYTAIVTGIVTFIALQLIGSITYGIAEGVTGVLKVLFSGIIVKVIILVALFRALGDAKELQQSMEEKK